jgi:hypothetical protein
MPKELTIPALRNMAALRRELRWRYKLVWTSVTRTSHADGRICYSGSYVCATWLLGSPAIIDFNELWSDLIQGPRRRNSTGARQRQSTSRQCRSYHRGAIKMINRTETDGFEQSGSIYTNNGVLGVTTLRPIQTARRPQLRNDGW